MRTAALMLLILPAACAGGNGADPAAPSAASEGPCRDDGLDRFVGQTVDATLGARLLEASDARTLRWGGPGMAMTMDFRADRLTVSYDGKMAITSVRCG